MNINKIFFSAVFVMLLLSLDISAKNPDTTKNPPAAPATATSWRASCTRPTKQIELEINNVRARLLTSGNLWYDANYIVPKPAPGQLQVSALFAGLVVFT